MTSSISVEIKRAKRPQKQTAKSKLFPIKKMAKKISSLHRESSREFYELNVARLCGTKSHIIIFLRVTAVGERQKQTRKWRKINCSKNFCLQAGE